MACRFYLFDDNLRCMSKAELVTTVETEFGITEKQKRFVEEIVYNDGPKLMKNVRYPPGMPKVLPTFVRLS